MRTINKPDILQANICDTLPELAYRDRVIEKSNEYEDILIEPQKLLDDERSFEDDNKGYSAHMKKMYSERFSNSGYKKPYIYYRRIRDAEKTCPYCGLITRLVKQLEHYLPKAKYPSLALTVNNLVPVCMDCNNAKKEIDGNQFIHPYCDTMLGEPTDFLKCRIEESVHIGFIFYIEKLPNWNDSLYKRACFHFEKLGIRELYTSDFVADFSILIEELKLLHQEGMDMPAIRKNVERKVISAHAAKTKPWSYAGYKCVLESDWFFSKYLPTVFT